MATVGTDGKPAIRTIQFQWFENGRIYFQTDTNASLYKDLQKLPYIKFVSSNRDYTESLRISAEVVFEYNYELIDRTLEMFPNIKKIYGSADNPILTMFYIEHGSASMYEFSDDKQGNTLQYEW
ncbi:pyridoxamine 5'-phosphate oxidase family protein [Paenibacillus borealis]|nr:pyridoxamine 5'-phosphate oxidase family protein [Paenibacillus borealis]